MQTIDRTKGIIVYGPQGCGKTLHAAALARHFGKKHVNDDFMPGDAVADDTLAICSEPLSQPGAISFSYAMREAGLDKPAQARVPYSGLSSSASRLPTLAASDSSTNTVATTDAETSSPNTD